MQKNRENLINIISRCNSKEYKTKWIHEMVSLTDIECTESECDSCPILEDCLETCNTNITECISDCKIDDTERCGGCQYAK